MLNEKVTIIKGRLYGFEKNPEYSHDFCCHMIHMRVCDEEDNQKDYLNCSVGKDEVDKDILSTIKDNIDTMLSDTNNTKAMLGYEDYYRKDKFHYTGVPVKLVMLSGKVIALANNDETLFKLLDNFLSVPVKEDKLEEFSQAIIDKNMIKEIEDFTEMINNLSKFLKNNPNIETLYPQKYDELHIAIDSLKNTLKGIND